MESEFQVTLGEKACMNLSPLKPLDDFPSSNVLELDGIRSQIEIGIPRDDPH
jgi:hypothetical protein